jgi:hypothetical protein
MSDGRPVWLYTARYMTDGSFGLGPALVNWLLGWVPGPIKPMLSRIAIVRMDAEPPERLAESPAE